jgi:DNA-binding Lrp family transcriptional regulator
MKTFDRLDRQILKILDTDGVISISELARKMQRGRDTVAYRLRRLEETGTLGGVEPIIDPGALGLGLYKTYLSFARSPKSVERILKALRTHPDVYCAARAFGRWDLMFNMVSKDAREFSELRDDLLARSATDIREMESAVFTEMVYFNRKYLGDKPRSWIALSNTKDGAKDRDFDDSFKKVMRRICLDARTSETAIAQSEKLTPIVVRTRRQQAEQNGVVIGYRARFDRTAFELSSYKLHIQLRRQTSEVVQGLRNFAHRHPYVSQFMLHIGRWPCEMNIEAHDNRHVAQIIDELRAENDDALGLIDISLYERDSFSWGFGMSKFQPEKSDKQAGEREIGKPTVSLASMV